VYNYNATFQHFPAGTLANPDLPPEKRLSWLAQLWPAFIDSWGNSRLDPAKAWDADENCPPRWVLSNPDHDPAIPSDPVPRGEVEWFLCPANPARNGPGLPSPTHYVGVAGVGADAAELPLADRRAGFFGYDRTLTFGSIKDGASTTLMLAEVVDGGPFTAGGRATVRGLAVGTPYLGAGGQFAGLHLGEGFIGSRPVVTNVAFADGHVRPLTDAVSPAVFEGIATVAGGEPVGEW
jgi:prepilin-type processing-associated H-X9-DG protein